ncbi:hypothetical protein [Thiorhodococcus drewsii]|uniref:hypothetical protein n=1 Tax=Thiorhodococcus drewsii TaxID=210408 RepID=UPI001111F154|nr:hypothetical protein [Thiorhodococcus drewsii]
MQVECENCKSLVAFEQNDTGKWVGRVIGGAGGAWLGSSMGIALLGTAISGMLPVAIVGAIILGNVLDDSDEMKCPKCKARIKIKS